MRHDQLVSAVYTALNVSAVTSLLSTAYAPLPAIFSADAPQVADAEKTTDFPFLSYLIVSDQTLTTNLNWGMNALVQIDVWHRTPSMAALVTVSKAVFDALNRQSMAGITGHIDTFLEDVNYVTEPDGRTKRAVMEFRITSLPTS